jgi:hypothetical protein
MIYTFNTKDFLLYPVMKSCFALNENDVYKTIQDGFVMLQKQLALKGISYDSLKGALIPNQDKDKYEACFVIDSTQIASSDYGYHVFEKLIPLLDKESTYSILCGDYIDFLYKYRSDSQHILHSEMNNVLARCHKSNYKHSGQFYLIYINRLTGSQRLKIVEGLYPYSWFTGFADVTHSSCFKSYISNILVPVCIKSKNRIIVSHPSDYEDDENINMRGFPFESNGFKLSSINDDSYGAFLSYKIESEVPDKEDVSFSFNALFPKFDSFEKIDLHISDDKWNKYLTEKDTGKGQIIELLGYDSTNKEQFINEVFKHICANYIYNLRENEYGDLMFNVCVELPTINGHFRKTTIALKYHPDTGAIDIVTVT